jgi:hypothetical protein
MTKEEFDSLKIGDIVYCNGTRIAIHGFETIHTEVVNDGKHEANFIIDLSNNRRNRLTIYLEEKDKLVDFLEDYYGNAFYNQEGARQIRVLLGKESKELKFPSQSAYDYNTYNWFIEQVKALNK